MQIKFIKIIFLWLWLISLTACNNTKKQEKELAPEVFKKAIQIGEAQAVVKIIQRAQQNPCQPIYLFNYLDDNNKQEVNLINIKCKSLGLPDPNKTIKKTLKSN